MIKLKSILLENTYKWPAKLLYCFKNQANGWTFKDKDAGQGKDYQKHVLQLTYFYRGKKWWITLASWTGGLGHYSFRIIITGLHQSWAGTPYDYKWSDCNNFKKDINAKIDEKITTYNKNHRPSVFGTLYDPNNRIPLSIKG